MAAPAGIWGGKGQGKTFQVTLAYKKLGIAPIVMSAGELESGNAGEPAKLIRQRYREASDIIKKGKMCSLFINDLDAGARLPLPVAAAAAARAFGRAGSARACHGDCRQGACCARLLGAGPGLLRPDLVPASSRHSAGADWTPPGAQEPAAWARAPSTPSTTRW